MLYMIGIGLGNEKDITLNQLDILNNSDLIYLECYTSMINFNIKDLEMLINKKIILADRNLVEKYLIPTLKKDQTKNKDEAVLEIYRKIRPGEPLILENAYETINNLLFNQKRYSLADVGRYKINKKLGLDIEIKKENRLLTKEDIIVSIKYLLNLTQNKGIIIRYKDNQNFRKFLVSKFHFQQDIKLS